MEGGSASSAASQRRADLLLQIQSQNQSQASPWSQEQWWAVFHELVGCVHWSKVVECFTECSPSQFASAGHQGHDDLLFFVLNSNADGVPQLALRRKAAQMPADLIPQGSLW